MKKIVYSLLVVFLFVGCYEINEEITLNKNGSGTYVTKMDMGAMLQMIQNMAGEEELSKNGMDRIIDTVIHLNTIMDTAQNVTAEQKRLYRDGEMRLQLNVKESVFKADMSFPFKNYNDLQALMSGSGAAGLGQAFKNIFAKNDSTGSAAALPDQGMDQISNVYDVTVDKNTISRKLNKEKFDSLMQRPEIAQAKQMMGAFEILCTTSIRLPKPAKKVNNTMMTLSADKKTVTMKYDLLKILDTPEKFSYTIEY
jgi:hypothetical protein